MDTDFLDWALADFSGYVAADELYDGPFCILSAVDNRHYKRILYALVSGKSGDFPLGKAVGGECDEALPTPMSLYTLG
jgi:hypothetical protein